MLQILEYTDEYKQLVPSLVLHVYENELGFIGYDRPDIYTIKEFYNKKDGNNFWVAVDNGKLVGTVGILHKGNGLVYLKRMIVDKAYRTQGIGKQLLAHAISYAQEKGYQTMYAGTVKENPQAIQFYIHRGFVHTADVPEDITAASNSICLSYKLEKR